MAIGPWQIAIIVLIVVLLFGAGRLSEIGKGLGQGIKNFKKGIEGDDDDDDGEEKLAKGKDKKRLPSKKSKVKDAEFEEAEEAVADDEKEA